MSDLTSQEQDHVRSALRYLRARFGAWTHLATALHLARETPEKIAAGRRGVTPTVAFRVARLAKVGLDALLDGLYVPAGCCPSCGHPPVGEQCPSNTLASPADNQV